MSNLHPYSEGGGGGGGGGSKVEEILVGGTGLLGGVDILNMI